MKKLLMCDSSTAARSRFIFRRGFVPLKIDLIDNNVLVTDKERE